MPLAVCRIQKIKSWGMLKGNEAHTIRERDTPNANPEVTNIRIIGSSNNIDLATLVKEKIGKQKIRSNAVLAVEMLLSASASYFRPQAPHEAGVYDKQRLDKFVEATVNWLQSSWGERIIRAELHLDEITPHIHAYLVPLDERGKLNCRGLFGGRIKLSQLQDSFGNAVAHLGISRGIKGSTATYTTLKKYYAAVNQDSRLLNLEQFFPKAQVNETSEEYRQRIIEILTPEFETINYQLNERSRLLQQKAKLEQTALKSERFRQELESELQILKKSIQTQELPLELVAYELGLNQHNQYLPQQNAIDLVMQVNQCKFDDSLVWLHDRFGSESMLAAVKNHAVDKALYLTNQNSQKQFIPPSSSHNHWKQVEYYLKREHSIPQSLIQILYKRKLIYADIEGNAVFIARNLKGEATGAYLYSSTQSSNDFNLHSGSKRLKGWFHLSMGGNSSDSTTEAVLVESPIKTLQLMASNAPHKSRTLYLCVDSEHAPLPTEFLQNVPNITTQLCYSKIIALKNSQSYLMEPLINKSGRKNKSQQTIEI
ncbi:MAG: MobV family relaxase [Cyanobacteria bacterium J06633_8]